MSIFTFFKLVNKAFKFAVNRPIQRFNIYNRVKKYLGPDAKYFAPAPRAIGSLSLEKPKQFPTIKSGYKSIAQKRLEALEEGSSIPNNAPNKSYSETKSDDNFVIDGSNKIEVTKQIDTKLLKQNIKTSQVSKQLESGVQKSSRPLPKSTSLELADPASIWVIDKTPQGRLNLNMLQEIMLNKLADDKYWTAKVIAEKYNIKEAYAESLIKYLKQIQIIISPGLAKILDYTSRNDPVYQASKHLIYHVDKSLRSEGDKMYDKMFLPNEDLPPEVREVLSSEEIMKVEADKNSAIVRRPEPLRIEPANKPKPIESKNSGSKRLEASKQVSEEKKPD